MKDIPVFTTENGVAGLVLKEIAYTGVAYVTLRATQSPKELLQECADFCRMCGAEKIYATGHEILEKYPFHTAVLQLQRPVEGLPETDAALFPVQEHTARRWQEIYNEKMKNVPNASWMTDRDRKEMLQKGDGYFIHRNGLLLGIGRASAGRIDVVASTEKGAGQEIVSALCHGLCGETAGLEVASGNKPAMALYTRLGFLPVREISKWYQIL